MEETTPLPLLNAVCEGVMAALWQPSCHQKVVSLQKANTVMVAEKRGQKSLGPC